MIARRTAILGTGILLVAMFANGASRKNTTRITVLDSEIRALSVDDNGVPLNCEQLTFDAYCRSSRTPQMTSTLLVQEGNEPPFRITCKIESRYSRCTPLRKGESFEAKRSKKGITVYYVDDNGKARQQVYTLVNDGGKAGAAPPTVAVATSPSPSRAENVEQASSRVSPVMSSAARSSPAQAPAVSMASVQAVKVKCNFTSTPPGAEISVDWRYVGNTPSEIGLSAGTHVVVISMPGFAEWKRELTVGVDSAVNVTANLQRAEP